MTWAANKVFLWDIADLVEDGKETRQITSWCWSCLLAIVNHAIMPVIGRVGEYNPPAGRSSAGWRQ